MAKSPLFTSKFNKSNVADAVEVKPTATRARSRKAEPVQPEVHAADTSEATAEQLYAQRMASAQSEYLRDRGVDSRVRTLCAWAAGFFAWATTLYVGVQLMSALTLAALAFTGSGFIAFLVYALIYVITIVASVVAGAEAYQSVKKVSVDAVTSAVDNTKARVSGFFGRFRRNDTVAA